MASVTTALVTSTTSGAAVTTSVSVTLPTGRFTPSDPGWAGTDENARLPARPEAGQLHVTTSTGSGLAARLPTRVGRGRQRWRYTKPPPAVPDRRTGNPPDVGGSTRRPWPAPGGRPRLDLAGSWPVADGPPANAAKEGLGRGCSAWLPTASRTASRFAFGQAFSDPF